MALGGLILYTNISVKGQNLDKDNVYKVTFGIGVGVRLYFECLAYPYPNSSHSNPKATGKDFETKL